MSVYPLMSDLVHPFPFAAVQSILSEEDDPALWREALTVITEDFARAFERKSAKKNWGITVGACSHWLRPHQSLWAKGGGFAYPDGYDHFRPKFDWSVSLLLRDGEWIPVVKPPSRGAACWLIAIPSRTSRHKQAAVYTRWHPGTQTVFYGFRKREDYWECVAISDEDIQGRVLHPRSI
jgi:hypothetical protein